MRDRLGPPARCTHAHLLLHLGGRHMEKLDEALAQEFAVLEGQGLRVRRSERSSLGVILNSVHLPRVLTCSASSLFSNSAKACSERWVGGDFKAK